MSKLKTVKINTGTKQTAFSYQDEAFRQIRDLEYAAIFHEQGLGKTKIAIDLILYWLENNFLDTVLVVAKKGLLHNWLREFKFHTFINPSMLTQSHKVNFHVFNSPAKVILTHYEVFKTEHERLKLFLKTRDVGVILDESTKIKNPNSDLTESFLSLSELFKKKVIMTGTPVANRPQDIWSQIKFLDQGKSLGQDYETFKRSVDFTSELSDDPIEQSAFETNLSTTFGKLSLFSVRETKDGGIIELPEKKIYNINCVWENYQHSLYQQYRNELKAIIFQNGRPTEDAAENVLKRLLRLVQIASNPKLVDESYSCEPGKFPELSILIQKILDKSQKCIIWSSFNGNIDWLARELKPFGVRRIHGGLSMDVRNRSVEKFICDPGTKILIATPGSAKEGLTLTVANHVIFYDRGFSLDDYLQAQDRIHRISQENTCYVYNLLMQDSIDEWVDALLYSKQLAAQLSQGDITVEYFKSHIEYDFFGMLKDVLGKPD